MRVCVHRTFVCVLLLCVVCMCVLCVLYCALCVVCSVCVCVSKPKPSLLHPLTMFEGALRARLSFC